MTDDTKVPASGIPAWARASSASKDHKRRFSLLASIIVLASAGFVLIVFGIGRMPFRAKDADSVATIPEPPRSTDPPVPPSETSAAVGDAHASPIARAVVTSRRVADEAIVGAHFGDQPLESQQAPALAE